MIHALHIGIDDYVGTENDLTKCVIDAKLMQSLFHGELLLNRDATRAAILAAIQAVVYETGPNDWCVITYSGHGSQVRDRSGDERDGLDETLVAADLYDIVDDEFPALLAQINPRARGLFVTDSCFSGTVQRVAPALHQSHLADIRRARIRYMPSELLRRTRKRITNAAPQRGIARWIHLSGCTDFEFSYEGAASGVLTGAFCECYRPIAVDKFYAKVTATLRRSEYGPLQHPQLNCSAAAKKWKLPAL